MCYFHDKYFAAPDDDHLEITVFGPGYGESIVLHIPTIGWGIIDSCEFKSGTKSVNLPLEYLNGILSPDFPELAFVILTHPHEDHYKGLDTIIKSYPGKIKRICWYSGDGVRELKQYICQQKVAGREVLPGFAEVIKTMQDAVKTGAQIRRLSELTSVAESPCASLIALSPSASNIKMYVQKLFKAIPQAGKPVLPMNNNEHNLISVALFLKYGNVQAILGSDLETKNDKSGGWNAIIYNDDIPDLWATFVKVPHHGSMTGYSDEAWEEHCKNNKPIAAITPFVQGNIYLPDENLVKLLKNKVEKLYLTSFPKLQSNINKYYKKDVERNIRSRTRDFKIIEYPDKAGFIRFRFAPDGKLIENTAVPPSKYI